jgi:hypothetical protein
MKYITCVLTFIALYALPSYAQSLPPAANVTTEKITPSVVLKSASYISTSAYLVRHQRLIWLKSTLVRASYGPNRPDSELPKTMRYALGGTLAAVSVASFAGGIGLGIATVDAFQSDTHLSNTLGVLTAMMSAGAIGFSITSGVWSVRLFRGKAMLLPPSH